jgi:hypothetical protein
MAVLEKISVGDIFYYLVDNIPTHDAPKGSVSIVSNDSFNGFVYSRTDGAWVKKIVSAYGEMNLTNNTTVLDWGSFTEGAWYSFSTVGGDYVSTTLKGFIVGTDGTFGDFLRYTGDTTIRAVVKHSSTIRGGSGRWLHVANATALNFAIQDDGDSETYLFTGSRTSSLGSVKAVEMSTNDQYSLAWSPIDRQGGGPANQRQLINKHGQLGVYKIDEAISITQFDEDFESSGFTENAWTVVNDSENIWVVGQAENNGGTSAAYVSNNGGTSATYNINNAEVSHFYKDFTIPSNAESITLTFDWKCQGENAAAATQYDYGTVVIAPIGTTPVAGTEVTTVQTGGAATTRLGATTNLGKFNLNYGTTPGTTWNTESIDLIGYQGETKRLIFTWKNDGSVGVNPPFVVDNIKININTY